MTEPAYDPTANAIGCWELAIAEERRKYIADHPDEATEAERE